MEGPPGDQLRRHQTAQDADDEQDGLVMAPQAQADRNIQYQANPEKHAASFERQSLERTTVNLLASPSFF